MSITHDTPAEISQRFGVKHTLDTHTHTHTHMCGVSVAFRLFFDIETNITYNTCCYRYCSCRGGEGGSA
jgi:hypothetical protein